MSELSVSLGVFNCEHAEIAHQILNLIIGDLCAEVFRRDLFDEVRFIEDHRVICRKHRAVIAAAQTEVSEEKMVIDDDDVGFLRAVSHASDKTGIEVSTLLTQTRFGASIDVTPERQRFGKIREFGAIAGLTFSRPVTDLVEVVDFIETFEHWR